MGASVPPELFFAALVCGSSYLGFSLGLPIVFTTVVVSFQVWVFVHRQFFSGPWCIRQLMRVIGWSFFREVAMKGEHELPTKGPIIFVCGPHANQFIDPAIVTTSVDQDVFYLCAAKTMARKYVGMLAKLAGAIPVERPQDLKKKRPGTITCKGPQVTGVGTDFLKDAQVGYQVWYGEESDTVISIETATELTLRKGLSMDVVGAPFEVSPKVDQSQVFSAVHEALRDGQRVGIFPEGGSHDRSEMLPLKGGVSIMALGAEAKYPGLGIKIVPVGLTYYHPHRFRSRAFVEFGHPMDCPPELIEQYNRGERREACDALLKMIRKGLDRVTVSAPTHSTLEILWAVERLYRPNGVRISHALRTSLARRLVRGYEHFKDDTEVQQMFVKIAKYNMILKQYGLKDWQVAKTNLGRLEAFRLLVFRALMGTMFVFAALPGLILNAPVIILTRIISRKKRIAALKSSSVKIAAIDVVGTWKVLVAMVLVPLLALVVYPLLAIFVAWKLEWNVLSSWAYFALLQPILSYMSIRSVEVGWEILSSLIPLTLAIFDPSTSVKLRDERAKLQEDLRKLINKCGEKLFGPDFRGLPEELDGDAVIKRVSSLPSLSTLAAHFRDTADDDWFPKIN